MHIEGPSTGTATERLAVAGGDRDGRRRGAMARMAALVAPVTPAQRAQQQRTSLQFVACMHMHRFPQLPDGWSGNIGQLISAGIDPHSPRLSAAFTKCGSW